MTLVQKLETYFHTIAQAEDLDAARMNARLALKLIRRSGESRLATNEDGAKAPKAGKRRRRA